MDRDGFSWRNRRRWIWFASAFCCSVIGYVLLSGRSDEMAERAMDAAWYLGGLIGTVYALGASVENIALTRKKE